MPLDPIFGTGIAPAEACVPLLEHDTLAAMLTYRCYLRVAQRRFDQLNRLSRLVPENSWRLARANAAYGSAAVKLERQEILLATLVQRLGYVPRIKPDSFH
ncbi:transcriptional repressor TraM [Paradevosia shaoguanensis]|uniref:transcriptional repressor TraM n=1 Tax=Paradevosia shaoguanensis TaxID=1335043 RepID=UPI003632985D